jgi:hypothetical protein
LGRYWEEFAHAALQVLPLMPRISGWEIWRDLFFLRIIKGMRHFLKMARSLHDV